MEIRHDAWVVVADGGKWLVMRNDGDRDYLNLKVIDEESRPTPPDRELASDRPGRMGGGHIEGRSAVDETDFHDQNEERLAKDLADHLYDRAHKGAFSEIVIVAPPSILGVLRQNMHQEVTDKISAEIDKDLTNHPIRDIEKILKSS